MKSKETIINRQKKAIDNYSVYGYLGKNKNNFYFTRLYNKPSISYPGYDKNLIGVKVAIISPAGIIIPPLHFIESKKYNIKAKEFVWKNLDLFLFYM